MNGVKSDKLNQREVDFLVTLITEKLKFLCAPYVTQTSYHGFSSDELVSLVRKIKEQLK